jgi:protein farnesyltransferase subunit beta
MNEKDNTKSSKDQLHTEELIKEYFDEYDFNTKDSENFKDKENSEEKLEYFSKQHYEFARKLMRSLPQGYEGLDSGLPWFSYWVLNILSMCEKNNYELSHNIKLEFVNYLKELQHEDGGFCGYSKGIPHIISTYSAVMSIMILGIKEAYDIVDLPKMRNFLLRMKNNNFNSGKIIFNLRK